MTQHSARDKTCRGEKAKPLDMGRGDYQNPAGLQKEQRFDSLSTTAQNILQASWKIVIEEGLSELSFARIAQLSGENRGSITYHFGSKEGLVLALIDAYVHDATINVIETVGRLSLGEGRGDALFEQVTNIATDQQYVLGFAELFPATYRNPEMLKSMNELYNWYRQSIRFGLDAHKDKPHYDDLDILAHLILGLTDGLSIQHMIEPDNPQILKAVRLMKDMVGAYLEKIGHLSESDALGFFQERRATPAPED
jgi:AcrR family transcriptional regulator